jgi:hypothetical protein
VRLEACRRARRDRFQLSLNRLDDPRGRLVLDNFFHAQRGFMIDVSAIRRTAGAPRAAVRFSVDDLRTCRSGTSCLVDLSTETRVRARRKAGGFRTTRQSSEVESSC